jgi:hypothetical protein
MKTLEDLARECAEQTVIDTNNPMDPGARWARQERAKQYLSFLAAAHAGPLKGVGESLREAENVMQISANIQDMNRGAAVHKDYDMAAGLKRVLPLVRSQRALLNSIQQPKDNK